MSSTRTLLPPEAARPLRWWSPARLAALRDRLGADWTSWCSGWGWADASLAASVASDDRAAGASDAWSPTLAHGLWERRTRDAATGVRERADDATVWAATVFSLDAPAATPMQAGVGRRIDADFQQLLVRWRHGAVRSAEDDASFAATDMAPGSGALRLRLSAVTADGPWERELHATAACADGWSVFPTLDGGARRGSLSPISQCLSSRSVRVQARLSDVVVTIGELEHLAVGDVLALPHALEHPLRVHVGDASDVACFAYLGRRADHLAIECVAVTSSH